MADLLLPGLVSALVLELAVDSPRFSNKPRRGPGVLSQHPLWPGSGPLLFGSQSQPSISLALHDQQPAQDDTGAAGAEEAARSGASRLQACRPSSPFQQPLFAKRAVRRRLATTLHQRRLHQHDRPVSHAHLHHRPGRHFSFDRAHHPGAAVGVAALLSTTAYLYLLAAPLSSSAVLYLDRLPQPVPTAQLSARVPIHSLHQREHVTALWVSLSSEDLPSGLPSKANLESRHIAHEPPMMYSMPPVMHNGGMPQHGDGPSAVRVVQSRPKPQCWEHGCNGRQFSTFSNLLRHQREKSGQASKASCPDCGAEFTRTTARNGHLLHQKCKTKRQGSMSSN